MAQRPKPEVRAAIIAAAARSLARSGLAGATLAGIANDASTSIGNLYKYFPNKESLFAATIPESLVTELVARFRLRIQSLGAERDVRSLGADHPYRRAAADLVSFSLDHRDALIFLLRHAEGTVHGRFRGDLERELVTLAVGYAKRAYPGFTSRPLRRRTLTRIYRSFVSAVASILEEEGRERHAREALDELVTYHLSGLTALFSSDPRTETP